MLSPAVAFAQPDFSIDSVNHRIEITGSVWTEKLTAPQSLNRAEFWMQSTHCQNITHNQKTNSVSGKGKTFVGRPLNAPLLIYYTLEVFATDSVCNYYFRNVQLAEGNTPEKRYSADSTLIQEEKSRPYPNPIGEKIGQCGVSFEDWIARKPALNDTARANQFSAYFLKKSRKNFWGSSLFMALGVGAAGAMLNNLHNTSTSVPQVLAGASILSISMGVLTGIKAFEYRKIARAEDAFTNK